MHEIITLQTGRQANFLATHFWNAQETYQTFASASPSPVNHDIHFRPGLARDGTETYLPRTLIYDLKGGFGSLAQVNALEGIVEDDNDKYAAIWNGPVTKLPSAAQPKISPYAHSLVNSETPVAPTRSTTPFFSDFASTYFHPRSLLPLSPPHPTLDSASNASKAGGSSDDSIPQFTTFSHGAALYSARDSADDILDTDLRPWLEECDSLQGIQLFTSCSDAWSGFAASYLEDLRDELPKTSIWTWSIEAPSSKPSLKQKRERAANRAQAIAAYTASSNAVVPLALPDFLPASVTLQSDSLWHTSALLSAAAESLTMPTRMKSTDTGRVPLLGDWDTVLGDSGRRRVFGLKIGAHEQAALKSSAEAQDARMQVYTGHSAGEDYDPDKLQEMLDQTLDVDLFPHSAATELTASRSGGRVVGRKSKTFARVETFRGSEDALEDLSTQFSPPRPGGPIIECYSSRPVLPQPITFPRIFSEYQASDSSVPIHASLSTSCGIAGWLRGLAAPFGPAGSSVSLPGDDLQGEEKEALRAALLEAADAYIEDWESGSEMEDDGDDE